MKLYTICTFIIIYALILAFLLSHYITTKIAHGAVFSIKLKINPYDIKRNWEKLFDYFVRSLHLFFCTCNFLKRWFVTVINKCIVVNKKLSRKQKKTNLKHKLC